MEWQKILISVVSIILTALASWLTQRVTTWINSKIANSKNAKYLTDAVEAVARAVKVTYQTYVQNLKDRDVFDKDAQTQALEQARDMAISQFSQGVKEYLESNFGNVANWVDSTIEATIYDLKNGGLTMLEVEEDQAA